MSQPKLAKNATLETVVPTLRNPEKHIAQVLANMTQCRKAHGNAHVRIGTSGQGKMPFHQVSYFSEDGNERFFGSFDGKNPIPRGVWSTIWSSASMSRDEVMALLGRVRSVER